jgi:exosome complex component CSL4
MALPSIALPGQILAPATKYLPGPGTHIHNSSIYASIAGPVSSSKPTSTPKSTVSTPLPLISIQRAPPASSLDPGILGSGGGGGSSILPSVDSVILGRITRLGARFASLEILTVDDVVCREAFGGQIRREDVRATEKDKVKIEESFRVGDVVRGVVISLGDMGGYYVSTARNEFGVVLAWAQGGAGVGEGRQMVPVSWKEFREVGTGWTEGRKVAKPF